MGNILRQCGLWWRMEAGLLFCLVIGTTLPFLVVAQTVHNPNPAELPSHTGTPAKDAHIVRFHVAATDGALHISYRDGTDVTIPKERGRFADGEQTLTQQNFLNIQLADDRQHIGWLADYMICGNLPRAPQSSSFMVRGTS